MLCNVSKYFINLFTTFQEAWLGLFSVHVQNSFSSTCKTKKWSQSITQHKAITQYKAHQTSSNGAGLQFCILKQLKLAFLLEKPFMVQT